MYISHGQKLGMMSKFNSFQKDLVMDWVDKSCAMVSHSVDH